MPTLALRGAESDATVALPVSAIAARPAPKFELLGINFDWADAQPWWTPDGSPSVKFLFPKDREVMGSSASAETYIAAGKISFPTNGDSFSGSSEVVYPPADEANLRLISMGRAVSDSIGYVFYFHTSNLPNGATCMLSGVDLEGELPGTFGLTPDGKPIPDDLCFFANAGILSVHSLFDTPQTFVDLTMGIASGEWETIGKLLMENHGSGSSLIFSKGTDPKPAQPLPGFTRLADGRISGSLVHGSQWWSVSMYSPSEPSRATGARITVIHNVNTQGPRMPANWQVRVIALDLNGKECLPTKRTDEADTGAFAHGTYVFDELKVDQVMEFRLQVRPFQLINFPHVALRPKVPSPPTPVTFAPKAIPDVTPLPRFP